MGRRRDFLMTDMDALGLALAPKGISNAVQAVTDDAVDPFDTGGEKRINELICNGYSHDVWTLEKIGGDKSLRLSVPKYWMERNGSLPYFSAMAKASRCKHSLGGRHRLGQRRQRVLHGRGISKNHVY
jgi:hypothetical protein